jgi:hypothetical protein
MTRRKGRRGEVASPKTDRAREIVRGMLDAGLPVSPHKLQKEYGGNISHVTFDMALTAETARRDTLLDKTALDETLLSASAQEKLNAAMRAYQRKLDNSFRERVSEEVRKRIEEIVLPNWKQQIDEAQAIMNRRHGIMDKATFNKIRRCLHTDTHKQLTNEMLDEAFNLFMSLEKHLLAEKESPTDFPEIPSDLAEWDKMRRPMKRGGRQAVKVRA